MAPGATADDALQTIRADYLEVVYLGLTTSELIALPNGSEIMVSMTAADMVFFIEWARTRETVEVA